MVCLTNKTNHVTKIYCQASPVVDNHLICMVWSTIDIAYRIVTHF